MTVIRRLLNPAVALAVGTASAGAATLTVGPPGPDGCGGAACAFQSIQRAINEAIPGDTVLIYRRTDDPANNGCYDEHLRIAVAGVTLRGAYPTREAAACIGPTTGGDIVTIAADDVHLINLHISGKANNGNGGTNAFGTGGRRSGHGVFIRGADVRGATLVNCSVDFAAADNIRFDGDTDGDGVGHVVIRQCYVHHADTQRNIRIINGGGSAADRHVIQDNLIHTGQGVLIDGAAVQAISVEYNIIKGWPYYAHLRGSFPELAAAGFGGGWRYYSNCPAGVWLRVRDPEDAVIAHNLIIGTHNGIRVGRQALIYSNTVVNPFDAEAYDVDGTLSPAAIRDRTVGVRVANGFGGVIMNNLIGVTPDNRATGLPGSNVAPYYSPGITGTGLALDDPAGTLGQAIIADNNVWGFVDIDGVTPLNYGPGVFGGGHNGSFDPRFAEDLDDESAAGQGPCVADGSDADDSRCYELYDDNYFLSSAARAGSCHAEVTPNVAGAAEFVDLSGGSGASAPAGHAGLAACRWEGDAVTSLAIDFASGAAGDEPPPHGDAMNIGAFGGTARASRSGPHVLGPEAPDGSWE